MKPGAALYAGWVALVISGIIGGLGLAFQQPWLFPSLGPTIFIHTVTPNHEAARRWNTFVGHGIGAADEFKVLRAGGEAGQPRADETRTGVDPEYCADPEDRRTIDRKWEKKE